MAIAETLPVGRGVAQWDVWTTTARLVTTAPEAAEPARLLVQRELAAVDRAASRFRTDSEVSRLARAGGRSVQVSTLLAELVGVALAAAVDTAGDVDPTMGAELSALGYDQDLDRAASTLAGWLGRVPVAVVRRTDWRDVRLEGQRLTMPAGTVLDLGATAKAWAADHCAELVAREFDCGALVSLGGDIAVAGEQPSSGWTILVQDGLAEPASLVTLRAAHGLATSSTIGRSWRRRNAHLHHILDPSTCRPARQVWRTVSVAAASCVAANVLSTAAHVRGAAAPDLLRERGVAARLVALDGSSLTVNGWPGS